MVELRPYPPAATVGYAVRSAWAEHRADRVERGKLAKLLTVRFLAAYGGLQVTLDAAPPRLLWPDPPALAETTRRLAGLYRRLVLAVTPAGQPAALRNLPDLQAAWPALKAALTARYARQDAVTTRLIEATETQLRDPAAVFASLRHDYFYQLFFNGLAGQRFALGHAYAGPRTLSRFVAGTDLGFREVVELLPGAPLAPTATFRGRGTLDPARTPRAPLGQAVQARLALDPPLDPAQLRFTYETGYELEKSTGLPVAITARFGIAYRDQYRKDYQMTIQRVAAP